ncbi:hypothetical protein FEK30_00695 (plasmid) [Picosynechococcus sp. PCC 11901]|uniref:hypothetical protein n=1 Tax=Picosynechococcus sp. PCC 11901 TaxID=2579791 RepID=UPI0010FC03E2|nr:hypothetical protein [Picosynechococcus sp. PCC 11901]QCS48074.1 hypothetical protein FEK30_00695 [Picosynechococcus sp. PCC 11901]
MLTPQRTFDDRNSLNFAGKFIPTKRHHPCPVCHDTSGKCRTKENSDLVLCMVWPDGNVPGWHYHGLDSSQGLWGLYSPDQGPGFNADKHRAELQRLRVEHQAKEAQRLASLPTIPKRHQKILGYKAQLTPTQNADLLQRGLTQAEIDFALSKHWLFACQGGYGITALDSITRMFCGAQRALDDRTQRKYDWAIFAGRNHLKETGENPLFVWRSPQFNPSQPYEVKFCEGALKSLIRAFLEWRHNPQVILVGAAGGIFGEQSVQRLLGVYDKVRRFTLLPDADSQNLKKKNLYTGYGKLVKAIPVIKFADWGQWRDKAKKDCDEYFGRYRRRSPWDWLKPFAFEKTRRKAKERLATSDQLTADLVLSQEQFEALKRGDISLRDLTNQSRDVFLQAARGLGKTEFAGRYVNAWLRGIAPFHRKALAIDGGGKLGFTYRTDLTIHNGQLFDGHGQFTDHLAYCSESRLSLTRPINNLLDRGAGCFIDEFDQQLKNLLMSATHGRDGQRQTNIQNFWQDTIRAKETLGVSADLTDFEVKLFEKHTGRKPFVVKVEHVKKQRIDTVFEHEAQWWQKFYQLQDEGQRVLVLCSRKSDAKLLAHACGAMAIHADNAHGYKDFLSNPNQWLRQNRPGLFAVSPILGTGFSITADAFDAVLLYGWADNLTAADLMQFLDRYRLNVPRYIWVEETNHQYNQLTPDACFKARLAKAKASRLDDEWRWIDPGDPYFHYQAEKNWSLAHLRADLLARLERDTKTVNYELCQLPADEVKDIIAGVAAIRSEFKKHDATLTAQANNLTLEQAKQYRDREDELTEVERRSLYKFDLADWRVSEPETVTADDVLKDRKGRRRKELEKLEMQAFPQIAQALDQASIHKQKGGVCQQDISHHSLRVQTLENIGIGKILDHVLSGQEWHANHPIVREAAQILASQRDELALMGVRLTCGKNATPSAYFGALLRIFGLRTESKQITMNNRRIRVYCLDGDNLALTKADLVARLPRNIERYGELQMNSETPWIQEIYSLHTPFENNNNRGCVQPLNSLQDIGCSNLEPEPDPLPPLIERTQKAPIELCHGSRTVIEGLIRAYNVKTIRKIALWFDNYAGSEWVDAFNL